MLIKELKYLGLESGVSLLELIFFIVIVGVATGALFTTYNYSLTHNTDPIIQVRALDLAQARLDEILALKYDEKTPSGGIPACGATGGVACDNNPDANMNDVDDFNNISDTPASGYTRKVTVTTNNNKKFILVSVNGPRNTSVSLSAFRANF